jgi:DNA-binding HxlR family transcriptional regulator
MKESTPCWHQDSDHAACNRALAAVRDSLYVIGGKWKLPIIITLMEGPIRFRELQRALDGITPKVLSKELKDLELNAFVIRTVYDTTPVTVEYKLSDYSRTLKPVLNALRIWGEQHREHIRGEAKASRENGTAKANRKATLPK